LTNPEHVRVAQHFARVPSLIIARLHNDLVFERLDVRLGIGSTRLLSISAHRWCR
jgi:hypothetical protein